MKKHELTYAAHAGLLLAMIVSGLGVGFLIALGIVVLVFDGGRS